MTRTRLLLAALTAVNAWSAESSLTLHYSTPATTWVEALPVGNGRLGGMVFGGPASERIQFNEATVWTGEPHDYAHAGAHRHLGTIRQLLFAGKQAEAEKLAMTEFMSVPLGQRSYQPFGDLELKFDGVEETTVQNYRRSLDLDSAVAATEFTSAGTVYRREVLASYPAQVLVVRLTANQPGKLSFAVTLTSPHAGAVTEARAEDASVQLRGAVANSAIRFEARLLVQAEGGSKTAAGPSLRVEGANAVTLILAGATNFENFRSVAANPVQRNETTLGALKATNYAALRAAHVADYQRLFRRVSIDLGGNAAAIQRTDERVRKFSTSPDPNLIALLFQYGRYLLISSSRQGGQPANLQGIWNDRLRPPWDSKYTTNINAEMNYWPAEVANLAECHQPLFDAMAELAVSGAVTAREHYAARGWVLHHNFDLWRGTAPINHSNHGIWPTGGAWLALHAWEHYRFGGDKTFLKDTAYPLLRGAALFFVDTLVAHPDKKWFISGPSNSPEQGGLVMGPTMDHQIIRTLFAAVNDAASILNVDADLRSRLMALRSQIAPNIIGRHGQLQEWLEDVDDPKNRHRHVSHLWGVYPGEEITPANEELFDAARKSLEFRGDAATGWSMGWKVNLWARFRDGAHAYTILNNLITPASNNKAGLYPNLFDAHPPFQIDGNFGVTAGIAEMLLQSHNPGGGDHDSKEAFITLLPALPPAFPNGKVSGLRARHGFTVSIEWQSGVLVRAVLNPARSIPVNVNYQGRTRRFLAQAGRPLVVGKGLPVTVRKPN